MNNKFWLFERKHYLPRPILTTRDLSSCRQLFPPTCNHRFRTSLSTWETHHHSLPVQTLCTQSIWQEPLPKAEYWPELTQWNNSYFKYTLIKKKIQQQQNKKLSERTAAAEIGGSEKDTERLWLAEHWLGTGITRWYRDLFVVLIYSN